LVSAEATLLPIRRQGAFCPLCADGLRYQSVCPLANCGFRLLGMGALCFFSFLRDEYQLLDDEFSKLGAPVSI